MNPENTMRRLESGQTIEGLRALAEDSYIEDQARLAGYGGQLAATTLGGAVWHATAGASASRARDAFASLEANQRALVRNEALLGRTPLSQYIPESVLTAAKADGAMTLDEVTRSPAMARIKAHAQTIPLEPVDPLRKALGKLTGLSRDVAASKPAVEAARKAITRAGIVSGVTALIPVALGFGSGKLLQTGTKRWLSREKGEEA